MHQIGDKMSEKIREVNDKVFKREISLCKVLSKANKGGCCWGKCIDCGVVPLLIKLHKGQLLELEDEIINAKKDAKVL